MIRCGANKTRPSMETLLAHEEEAHNFKDYFQIFLV